ncbi:MAG TPA: FTR1 family protein [Rhizomicrobium sp.]
MKTILVALLFVAHLAGMAGAAESKPDYRGMVAKIDSMLAEAASDYRAGKVDAAKTTVQHAYFQVFESMEGPIRINISAKHSYELESEFGAIRKLMSDGAPPAEVERRIKAHITALNEVVPTLESGAVLVAEKTEGLDEPSPEAAQPALSQKIEPYWQTVVASIHDDLAAAADALDKGDAAKATALINHARFEGYKNSELTIAIRRYVSQQQDGAYEAEFLRIAGLVKEGRPEQIRGSARVLAEELTDTLPGLPLVGAAAEAAAGSAPSADWVAVADKVNIAVSQAQALAADGKADAAVDLLQTTYFDVFEASGMEARIGARDPAFKTAIEAHFSKLMALINKGAAPAALAAEAEAMKSDLVRAAALLGGEKSGTPWALFGYALLIILREGFEAMVIVTAVIAYLVKTGHGDKQRVIGNSVFFAILASVATAALLKLAFREAAASQEVLEGGTMLAAAATLFFVSFWLISKAEAKKWTAYIKGKVDSSLSSGSMKALWFTCFLAVYREGAETVLFFQALTVGANTMGLFAVAGGFVAGCLGLGLLYWGMRAGALKLAIRPFFQGTGALLYLMAFVFTGQGIMELVEGKVFTPTLITGAPEIPVLGIYPYWQSLLPQAFLVAAALISLVVILRRRPGTPAAAETGAG